MHAKFQLLECNSSTCKGKRHTPKKNKLYQNFLLHSEHPWSKFVQITVKLLLTSKRTYCCTFIEFYCESNILCYIQCILAYPNSQKQDYNIIHIHFNDIHTVVGLSVTIIFFDVFHISEFFSYPNKHIFCLHKGVWISEDALYCMLENYGYQMTVGGMKGTPMEPLL